MANTVQVGPRERLAVQTIEAIRPTWTEGFVAGAWRGLVQVRAHGEAMPATIHVVTIPEELSEERGKRHEGPPPACVRIVLDQPALGIAPGQAAVYYDGDRVVGSATISATAA